MKKYIASILLLSSLSISASAEAYYGPITICQYEFSGYSGYESADHTGESLDNSTESAENTDVVLNDISEPNMYIQAYMLRYRHRGHIQCRGPIYKNGGIYTFDYQQHTYGRI